jgi:3-hydroxybutyrate dehydrogenase
VAQGGQGADIEENLRLVAAANPQGRLMDAGEIAALAVFLCRDEARGLTAEGITLSGGAQW